MTLTYKRVRDRASNIFVQSWRTLLVATLFVLAVSVLIVARGKIEEGRAAQKQLSRANEIALQNQKKIEQLTEQLRKSQLRISQLVQVMTDAGLQVPSPSSGPAGQNGKNGANGNNGSNGITSTQSPSPSPSPSPTKSPKPTHSPTPTPSPTCVVPSNPVVKCPFGGR